MSDYRDRIDAINARREKAKVTCEWVRSFSGFWYSTSCGKRISPSSEDAEYWVRDVKEFCPECGGTVKVVKGS